MIVASLHRLPILLAGLLVAGCPSSATEQGEDPAAGSETPAAPSAVPNPAVRGQANCRTATEAAQRRACGTAEAPMEYPLEIGISRLTYVSLGERAAEVSGHIDAANRRLANARWARPEVAADVLRAGAAGLRRSALRVCGLEGKPPTPGDSIRSDFLKAYVWLEYRVSLIEGAPSGLADRVDPLLADPCFTDEKEIFFGASPKALLSSDKYFYAVPSYFARALGHYHAQKGLRPASDGFGFRAVLGEAGDKQLSCLQGQFYPEVSSERPVASKLWDSCLRTLALGKSCLERSRRCTPADRPAGGAVSNAQIDPLKGEVN